jgi:hypothetical protein
VAGTTAWLAFNTVGVREQQLSWICACCKSSSSRSSSENDAVAGKHHRPCLQC